MDYKTLPEEQMKLPFNAQQNNVGGTQQKRKQHKTYYFILLILFIIVSLFFINYVYHLCNEENPEKFKAFENVKVKIDYKKSSRPTVKVQFKSKEFSMTHYFGDSESDIEEQNDYHHKFKNYFHKHSTTYEKSDAKFSLKKERDIKLEITKTTNQNSSVQCFQIDISSLGKYHDSDETVACFQLNPNYWFGGHEAYDQPYWPINNQSFDYKPYITGYPDGWAGVLERYWLSSNGIGIYVNQSVPLHVKHLDPNEICLMSDRTLAPYKYTSAYSDNSLTYNLCTGTDPKTVHTYMISNYIGKPKYFPDPKMITSPVWTTWAYYFTHINQTIVADFAQQIVDHGYPRSNLEIDDKWENNYGDLDLDTSRFPDMKSLSIQLHNLGFRVCLWVHPFCNIDSQCFQYGADNGYWVKSPDSDLPGLTSWWNGRYAGLLDTTNPNASAYYLSKLDNLKQKYLVDGFKFDAGESAWTPQAFKLYDQTATPNGYSSSYVRTAAQMGNFIEVRTGANTQDVGVFYRLLDRASDWTIHDGIKSVITETLQFSILGYPYVLPDIIYGNSGPDKTKKELFIRWTQLNAFLPAMQFSVPPWYFDDETDKICKEFANFHETGLSFYIIHLASQLDGLPIVRPMWWAESTDPAVFTISDQFMVGDEIVVAPVLDEGVTARDIYLPTGKWFDPSNNSTIVGPTWLRNYPVVLETIPYFLLNNGQVRNAPYFK